MDLRDKIIQAHKAKHEIGEQLNSSVSDMRICLQDHYKKPRLSVVMTNDYRNSALFEIDGNCLTLVDSKNFSGNITAAVNLVNDVLKTNSK